MDSGADELFAGSASIHDLMVTPRPVGPHGRGLIVVRAAGSLRPAARAGQIRIEHLSCTGHNGSIERPASVAVPLFWRFVIEKYGIRPPRRSSRTWYGWSTGSGLSPATRSLRQIEENRP